MKEGRVPIASGMTAVRRAGRPSIERALSESVPKGERRGFPGGGAPAQPQDRPQLSWTVKEQAASKRRREPRKRSKRSFAPRASSSKRGCAQKALGVSDETRDAETRLQDTRRRSDSKDDGAEARTPLSIAATTTPKAVSYTHLTLPTIYSV